MIPNDIKSIGLNNTNFQEVLHDNNIKVSTGVMGRKVTIGQGESQKTVSFNEVYKALSQIDQTQLNPEQKVDLLKTIVSLRQKDISSGEKWFLGKNIAKFAAKILHPFDKEKEIEQIEIATGVSPKLLEATAKFITKHPENKSLALDFLTDLNNANGEDTCILDSLTKGKDSDELLSTIEDWLELCSTALATNPTPLQTKTIVLVAADTFTGIRYPNSNFKSKTSFYAHITPNQLWTKSASRELQKAVDNHVVIIDTGAEYRTHIFN